MITEHVGHKLNENLTDYRDILDQAELNWNVEVTAGIGAKTSSGEPVYTSEKCATVRTDTNQLLGVVGKNYKVVQNAELVQLAQRVAGYEPGIKLVHGGAIGNGERVFLGLQMPSFNVGNADDEMQPYLAMWNGHNGKDSLLTIATTKRPFCSNIQNAATREGKKNQTYWSIRHKGDMNEKTEDLFNALSKVYIATNTLKEQANAMASVPMTQVSVSDYWDNVYTQFFDEIPDKVEDRKERRLNNKWLSTKTKLWQIYDREASELGSNLWIAFNAVTGHIDHNTIHRGEGRTENRFVNNIFGASARKKQKILDYTMTLV